MATWLGQNWFPLVQTGLLSGCLIFIGFALFLDSRARRVANLIQLTKDHRELWERMFSEPELSRILDADADLDELPVRPEEEAFVVFLILHLSNFYYGMRSGFFPRPQGLRKDIERFFSLPIPRAVWHRVKALQDTPFVEFVDRWFPRHPGNAKPQ